MVTFVALFALPVEKPEVRFFVLTDCPISRKFSPEIKSIYETYAKRANFRLVIVEPDITMAKADKFRKDFGYAFPATLDTTGAIAKAARVLTVPTVVVSQGGKTLYQGRIDNRFPTLGTQRPVTRKDLRIALDSILAGKPVVMPKTDVVGCALPQLD